MIKERVRLATQEEVASIADSADLTTASAVFAYDRGEGAPPALAVGRLANELDPVIFPEGITDRQRYDFMRLLENHLRLAGVREYYFNIRVSDETWIKTVLVWGAQQQSRGPEFRFRKNL